MLHTETMDVQCVKYGMGEKSTYQSKIPTETLVD